MSPRARKLLHLVLPLAISLALLVWLATHINISSSFALIGTLPPHLFLGALLSAFLCYFFSSLRFWLLTKPLWPLSLPAALGLNLLTILSAHGVGLLSDGLRVRALMLRGASLRQAVDFALADRILTLWLLLLCSALLFPCAVPKISFAFALAIVFTVIMLFGAWLCNRTFWPGWLQPCLSAFATAISSPARLGTQLAATLMCCIAIGIAFKLLAVAFGFSLPLYIAIAFAPLAILASSIPFTYAGLGTREAAFALGLPLLAAITPEQATALSLSFAALTLICSTAGLLFLPKLIRP